jgi:hypothetical protein
VRGAAGLGILASVVGAFVGALTTRTMDDLASYVPIGATVALFVGGSAGLFWRSRARRSTLLTIGMVIAVLGIALTLVAEGSMMGRTLNSEIADPTMQVLFPVDAAFVVLLCLVQPVQAATPSESHPGTDRS